MNEIQAQASHEQAQRLQAAGAVRAKVHGRPAIVSANSWEPITPDPAFPARYVKAREIVSISSDIEAQGTPEATSDVQHLIDELNWESWRS